MLLSVPDLPTLLAAPASGEGCTATLDQGSFSRLDPERFHSNLPAEVFTSRVLASTGGRLFSPPCRAYRLPGASVSPLVPGTDYWPQVMYVHTNEGRLVRDLLQRFDKTTNTPHVYRDPKQVGGTSVYMGIFMPYFGHFLSEVVSRFWICDALRGRDVTWHFLAYPESIKAWNADSRSTRMVESIMNEFGITRDRIAFVEADTVFEDMIAPTPLNVYTRGYNPRYRDIAARIRASLPRPEGATPERIFLSRSRFKGRNMTNAAQIEGIFEAHGFTIVHPQEHDLGTQAAMAAGADVIAGEEGSAFCNVMFADRPVIIELESGRYHQNLPRLSYMMARKYCYLMPCGQYDRLPVVGLKSRLWANPWIVDRTLADVLGGEPAGEPLCGPPELAPLMERAFIASVARDGAEWTRCAEAIAAYADRADADVLRALAENFD